VAIVAEYSGKYGDDAYGGYKYDAAHTQILPSLASLTPAS
jgi:hypothetical protein